MGPFNSKSYEKKNDTNFSNGAQNDAPTANLTEATVARRQWTTTQLVRMQRARTASANYLRFLHINNKWNRKTFECWQFIPCGEKCSAPSELRRPTMNNIIIIGDTRIDQKRFDRRKTFMQKYIFKYFVFGSPFDGCTTRATRFITWMQSQIKLDLFHVILVDRRPGVFCRPDRVNWWRSSYDTFHFLISTSCRVAPTTLKWTMERTHR